MKRFLKLLFGSLLVLLILLQFYPKSNYNTSQKIFLSDISIAHHVPAQVQQILKTSCYDCHSNNTIYPWYAAIQPVSLWLADHIKEGKAELNFAEFGGYSLRRQFRKLEEISEQVKEGEMPLTSYSIIHRNAKLSPDKQLALSNWTVALRDSFRAGYPADSLEGKKDNIGKN
ncbi:MAG: heme-binding domain-containing protein [Ferruginibacter sp.]|nr:heme-binding domain-containing protein [Ferruginibacter sp.]